ncbi:hypothetical protein JD522_10080 [Aeromonas hydrophila]|uniref:hypothetical protein n=1 Tax=Aeromonas hydrophila TaxID=644 RepID=UPI00191D18A1|nr:hypothetical protein [Aeromonas hydrophila]MBL0573769.1 hypothetical protein [Aeromonas hydrophila]
MAKKQRIDHFNKWPEVQEFKAETLFKERMQQLSKKELFFPYQIPSTTNTDIHISVSYLLDAVDSLPFRPDHAFDWTWRAFEYLANKAYPSHGSITNILRSGVSQSLSAYFTSNPPAADSYFDLVKKIPFQTCEYLLKRIIEGSPYTFTALTQKSLSSYAKRILFANGNLPVISPSLQTSIEHLSKKYDYQISAQRRNGASLLRRIIRGEQVTIDSSVIQLTRDEILFFLISGLGYAFRNDRAHAKSISPFRSSYAKVSTYAHCWFMFLLIYETIFSLLHTSNSPLQLNGCPSQNFYSNNSAFLILFGDYLNT